MRKIIKFIKKYLWDARAFILLGFLVFILFIRFGSKNSEGILEPSWLNSSIIILSFLASSLSLLGYLAMMVKDYFFRSSQMSDLAQKYNLNYTKPKEFLESSMMSPLRIPWLKPSSSTISKKNIIEGKINGKNILIYDFIDYYAYNFGIQGDDTISRSATIISVDGKKQELRGFFTGFASVKKIDSFLADLSKEK